MSNSTPSTIVVPVDDPSAEMKALVGRLGNAAEWVGPGRYSISSQSAPTESERRDLTRRADDLRRGLSPATKEEIRTSLLKWMAGLDLKLSPDDLEGMVAMFVASLMGLPLWAIRRTLLKWMQGKIADCNPRFTPKPPELRREANRVVADLRHELGIIEAGLGAKVEQLPTDAERDAAIARWTDEVRPTMAHATAPCAPERGIPAPESPATDPAAAEAARIARDRATMQATNVRLRERELAAHGITDGRPLGVEMRRKLGLSGKPPARSRRRKALADE